MGEIRALFEFVQNEIRYVRDIHNVETIHFPEVILENSQGDCDDKAVLLGAVLESIGHPVRLVAVGFRPGVYSHVYLETRFGKNGWLPLDATEPYSMGWKPKNIVERMERYI
ncbi:MAG: transglutaminase domain-containing protein [Patescibacteria group bacterium]|nr:transglutaminase domain-containing protein [Patescibacteria group bacterium]